MTASTPSTDGTSLPQWRQTTAYLVREALVPLAWTAGIALGLGLGFWLLSTMLGWGYEIAEEGGVFFGIEADANGVTVRGPFGPLPTILGQMMLALAVTVPVMAVVLPAVHTRVLIASGVTRRSITLGLTLSVLAMVAAVAGALLLVTLVAGASGMVSWFGPRAVLVGLTGLLTVSAVAFSAAAVTMLFLRWPWWVGSLVLAIAVLLVAVPLTALEAGLGSTAGVGLVVALLAAMAMSALLRRLPMR